MPLAIELAAARTSLLSLTQIEARLKDRFQLLSGGHITLPRHQTLRGTIEWSHDLLSEAEKVLFRRLAVFSGGWTLEAAESVVSDQSPEGSRPDPSTGDHRSLHTGNALDLLAGLVNKSLVIVEVQADGEVRYRMLETLREYAGEQLRGAGERDFMRARHFDYFFRMAGQAEPQLFHAESSIDWAEAELDNLRTALTWALERDPHGAFSEERAGRALDLMLHVWPLWLNRGYSIEGNEWLNQLLSVHTARTPARARGLLLAGDFAGFRGDTLGKMRLIQEALALAKELGDKKRIAWALMEMGQVERDRHSPEAIDFLSDSLVMFQGLDEALWVCRTSFLLAEALTESGDLQAARRFWRQGLDLCRAENDQWQMGWGLHGLGDLERLEGHLDQALQLYKESLQCKVSVRDKLGITYSLASFAQLAATQGQFRRAAMLWGAAERLGETLNLFLFTARDELHTSRIPDTRTRLGEEAFHSAWTEGRALKMQQAIDYALNQK
jgi:non-specific serine/threonine protein kinase